MDVGIIERVDQVSARASGHGPQGEEKRQQEKRGGEQEGRVASFEFHGKSIGLSHIRMQVWTACYNFAKELP